MSHYEFERLLINFLTSGENPALKLIRSQYESARLDSREMTGKGFYAHFGEIKSQTSQFSSDFHFGDVLIETDDLEFGGGCVVFIRNGFLSQLQCYSFGGTWSIGYPNIQLAYTKNPRDLSALPVVAHASRT